ncbi:MAG: glycerate kinase [Gemmatimonadota bacterium]
MSPPRAPRVVVAPNAFKGTFDAVQVARAWGEALADVARVDLRPMSDGGDGFVAVVRHYRPETLEVRARVPDPLGRPVHAAWGWDPDRRVAYLESAAAVGLRHLAPEERRPLAADTAGLGRLIQVAGSLGVRRLAIGLGGSATVDGGLGMARALGYRFLDARGRPIHRPGDLPRLARLAPPKDSPVGSTGVTALADVENPLLGSRGAAAVYGPQKGASPADVERLEAGLARLAERWIADLGAPHDLAEVRGAGAAGGLGAGLVAFLGARLAGGAGWCARLARLARALDGADLALTGEGRLDAQSLAGKATGYVLSRARRRGLPAGLVCAGAAVPRPDLDPSVTLVEGRAEALSLDDLGHLARRAFDRLREARP